MFFHRGCLNWMHLAKTFSFIGLLLFFCEVVIYYLVLLQCTWPQINTGMESSVVKAVMLTDTHMLGPRFGHWFDKLRREWQMYRTFQTTMTLHNPQVVFILGDLFDEGFFSNSVEFENYVKRFHSIFYVPDRTKLYVTMGNHDVGFHYRITHTTEQRFEKAFNVSSVELLQIRGNNFVLVNSMALQGDTCFLCTGAEKKLKEISKALRCAKGVKTDSCDNVLKIHRYSPPIFIQHFPLYRPSDHDCNEPDSAPEEIKNQPFSEEWDCLSKDSTQKIVLKMLQPRVAFSGHIHHGCFIKHNNKIPEWTLSSFNWRNKNNPSFILATFAPDTYALTKCYMPKESTVIGIYIVGSIAILFWIYKTRKLFFSNNRIKKT